MLVSGVQQRDSVIHMHVFIIFRYLFVFGCAGSLLLHTQAISSRGEQELLCLVAHRLLIVVASLVAELRY